MSYGIDELYAYDYAREATTYVVTLFLYVFKKRLNYISTT